MLSQRQRREFHVSETGLLLGTAPFQWDNALGDRSLATIFKNNDQRRGCPAGVRLSARRTIRPLRFIRCHRVDLSSGSS
jgi:hypothetical protein